jgi:hypothetical protein
MQITNINNMKKGVFVFFLLFTLQSFSQKIDYSLIPYRKGDKWGYANPDGEIIITPKYADARWFSEEMAAVKIGSKWGYINKVGKLVIPARFTVAKSFRKGFVPTKNKEGGDSVIFAGASIVESGYENCINKKGQMFTKCPAIAENSVASNTVAMETTIREKTYSVPNNNGLFDKIIDDYKIAGSNETFYIAQKGGMYGVFNTKFETIVPFEYNSVKQIKSGGNQYLQVKKNSLNGIIKGDGITDITPDYSNLVMINGVDGKDYVIVQKDGKSYVKDINNNDIIPAGYADVTYDDNGGFIITDKRNMRGFYFSDKKMIAPKYADIRMVNKASNYLQIKTSSGKVGYINTAGNEFFEE